MSQYIDKREDLEESVFDRDQNRRKRVASQFDEDDSEEDSLQNYEENLSGEDDSGSDDQRRPRRDPKVNDIGYVKYSRSNTG